MKKRLSTYFSLLVMLSSFLIAPLTVLAETTSTTATTDSTQQTQTKSAKTKESTVEADVSESSSQLKTIVPESKVPVTSESTALKNTQTDQKQSSEATQSTDQQTRAPARTRRSAQGDIKKLDNVITNVALWDIGTGQYVTQKEGEYQLVQNLNYRFETKFDLSSYDGNLIDGDYFVFTIPEPFTVAGSTFELKDEKTSIVIGNVVVTSKGEGKGASIKITLKNLEEYLSKTGGTQVQGVKGTFYADFSTNEVTTGKTITYNSEETKNVITHKISVKEKSGSDYTELIGKENFAKINGVIHAEQWSSEALGKTGEYNHPFVVRANTRQASYNTISIHDFISENHAPSQFIPETLKIQWGYFNNQFTFVNDGELVFGKDYTVTWNSAYTDLVVTINNASTHVASNNKPAAYRMIYSTTAPANGTKIGNYVEVTANEQELTAAVGGSTKQILSERESKVTTGGTIQLETGYRITLYKQDADTGDLINGAEFEITSPSGGKETIKIEKDGVAQSKVYTAEEVTKGKFIIIETKAPQGYLIDSTPIEVNVGESGVIRTIKNTREKISIPVTKTWEDNNNQDGKRPDRITVNLLADGEQVATQEVTETDGWTYTFKDLPKFNEGKEIVYTIMENQVPDYNTEITGFDITNSYTPGKTSVSVTKKWEDSNNQDGKRPNSVQVQLVANGEKQGDAVELNAANNWTTTWNELDQKANGKDIAYAVEEVSVPGYTTTIDDTDKGNILLTNTYSPETREVKGTKTWEDNNNQDGKRPDRITVNLLADGAPVATQEVTETDGWTYTFKDLPKFKEGKEIVYTITENTVDNYVTKIDGFNITNTYKPGKISGTVTKHWEDNHNQARIRPDSIKIQLYANGSAQGQPVKLTEKGNWTYSWNELEALDDEGKTIQYTIKEVGVVNGYSATVTGENTGNLLITNTHTPVTPNKSTPTTPNKSNRQTVLGKILPKTGEQKATWVTIAGLVVLLIVGTVYFYQKRKIRNKK